MAIIPITAEHIDTVTLEMHPDRLFVSSSKDGLTGSVYVFANRSSVNRQRIESSPFDSNLPVPGDAEYDASSYEACLDELVASNPGVYDESYDRYYAYETYLTRVNNQKQSSELNKYMEIFRFKPSFSFTSNTLRKSVVKDILFKFYSDRYSQLDWAYTNYNCLTFFTASEITPNSALIYPAPSTGETYNQYVATSSFTISLWVNPRTTTTSDQVEYRAGTILHSSSSFALSVVTGSERDDYGNPEAFRVLLQLSRSADIPPSEVDLTLANNARPFPQDLIFLSPDNSLKLNHWHHITVSWDANHNYGTGSMWIDAVTGSQTEFLVASSAINTSHVTDFVPLIVGNYYNHDNIYDGVAGYRTMAKYFNAGAASAEGIPDLGPSAGIVLSASYLNHKPNVDVHDIRIYNKYLTEDERDAAMAKGPSNLSDLLFYLPPFYVKESPKRTILTSPYFTTSSTTDTPFNTDLSFGVGGHDLNIENFTRDFATGIYPRHYCLTASTLGSVDTLYATANDILFNLGDYNNYYRARQLLLLPCDNGKFRPNYELLASGTVTSPPAAGSLVDKFVDDQGYLDYSLITLRNLVSTGSAEALDVPGIEEGGNTDIAEELHGGDWMTADDDPATAFELTVIQRTLDNSSNELYFFDASNLFYGNTIIPGTFIIEDIALTGSSGAVGMKIRDDYMGNLYRADCLSPRSTWSSVGNILYEEGIIVIKTPNIPLFGQDQFKISFKGLHNVHSHEVNVILSPNLFTSSSNPTFKGGAADAYANDTDGNYVAFNSILLHDDNLNVITRSNLAQPIIKKLGDKYLIRIKIDY